MVATGHELKLPSKNEVCGMPTTVRCTNIFSGFGEGPVSQVITTMQLRFMPY